jgi:uncharacterized C2H2 Zn-finger protein
VVLTSEGEVYARPDLVRRGKSLWKCPRCGRPFANRNQEHSCASQSLDEHFRGKERARELFDAFVRELSKIGPITITTAKTRIGIQTRMIFSAVMPRKDFLRGHLVLARRRPSPRFVRIDTISPRNHVHVFELRDEAQLDPEFRTFLREAYAVGNQEHLQRRG